MLKRAWLGRYPCKMCPNWEGVPVISRLTLRQINKKIHLSNIWSKKGRNFSTLISLCPSDTVLKRVESCGEQVIFRHTTKKPILPFSPFCILFFLCNHFLGSFFSFLLVFQRLWRFPNQITKFPPDNSHTEKKQKVPRFSSCWTGHRKTSSFRTDFYREILVFGGNKKNLKV